MCGIVGGVATNNITPILIKALKKLEYRGYDSSGIAVLNDHTIKRIRAVGKVVNLVHKIKSTSGRIGIAHTRWATHGKPSIENAHPHICDNKIAIVHNGIIENFTQLKQQQQKTGFKFLSDTDTETIIYEIFSYLDNDLLEAVKQATKKLHGTYALGVISKEENRIIAAKQGSPLIIGITDDAHFITSDKMALIDLTDKFIHLEDGDIADITISNINIYNNGKQITRKITTSNLSNSDVNLGNYKHFMHKEIFEQPQAITDTLEGRIIGDKVLINSFGFNTEKVFSKVNQIQIIACGTSFNAGLVAKYWLEDIAKIPTHIEVASEYRYRNPVVLDKTLFIFISQSGETADTLEVCKSIQQFKNNKSLAICNSAESSITKLTDLVFLTHSGIEIGVASTKTFTTQLVALALFTVSIGKIKHNISCLQEKLIIDGLRKLPKLITKTLKQEEQIKILAKSLGDKYNALFIGRGAMHAIAKEGALKMKEISYIHAESYPAGELKHGPIALIDKQTPVIAIAPDDELLNKLKANLLEVKSRGSQMIVFEDENSQVEVVDNMKVIAITHNLGRITAPIIFTIPLQLLSYHAALIKGTDIDKPRNLAKSVTVE